MIKRLQRTKWFRHFGLPGLLFTSLLSYSSASLAFAPSANIKVEGNWGKARTKDIQAVVDSVQTAITPYIGARNLGTIIIRNDPKGPISLYKRGKNGEYVVLLDIKGRFWAQVAYQYSHEVCHLLSNYDLSQNNATRQQWFEESICEAFSLFALERMAELWKDNPPYKNWKEYAPAFTDYVDNLREEKHRTGFAKNAMQAWFIKNKETLQSDPVAQERRLNEEVATHLYTIFSEDPQNWEALNYINLGGDDQEATLQRYLDDWEEHAPTRLHKPIQAVRDLLLIANEKR